MASVRMLQGLSKSGRLRCNLLRSLPYNVDTLCVGLQKELPYPLISDPKRQLITALGAGEGGKTKRSHFIFEKGGKLVEKKLPVTPADRCVFLALFHPCERLADCLYSLALNSRWNSSRAINLRRLPEWQCHRQTAGAHDNVPTIMLRGICTARQEAAQGRLGRGILDDQTMNDDNYICIFLIFLLSLLFKLLSIRFQAIHFQ